jgi:hypothetical protein
MQAVRYVDRDAASSDLYSGGFIRDARAAHQPGLQPIQEKFQLSATSKKTNFVAPVLSVELFRAFCGRSFP